MGRKVGAQVEFMVRIKRCQMSHKATRTEPNHRASSLCCVQDVQICGPCVSASHPRLRVSPRGLHSYSVWRAWRGARQCTQETPRTHSQAVRRWHRPPRIFCARGRRIPLLPGSIAWCRRRRSARGWPPLRAARGASCRFASRRQRRRRARPPPRPRRCRRPRSARRRRSR